MAAKTPKQRERERKQHERERRRLFAPYANELGWLIYEWNRLQEALGELFTAIVTPKHHSLGVGIWHSITSDRAQREMLAAANSTLRKKQGAKVADDTKAADDIKWLLNRVTELADKRNDAVHAPLVFVAESGALQLMPLFFLGNPRAAKLENKNLLQEFAWYRGHASALASFAENVRYAITRPEHFGWPAGRQLCHRSGKRKRRDDFAQRRNGFILRASLGLHVAEEVRGVRIVGHSLTEAFKKWFQGRASIVLARPFPELDAGDAASREPFAMHLDCNHPIPRLAPTARRLGLLALDPWPCVGPPLVARRP